MRRDIIGSLLSKERKRLNLTQQDVADQMELGKTTISYMERGLPTAGDERYMQYAQFLGIAEDLFGVVGEAEERERFLMLELRHIEDIVSGNPDLSMELIESLEDVDTFFEPNIFSLYLKGRIFFEKQDWDKSKKNLEKALKGLDSCSNLSNSNLSSICLNELGKIAFYKQDYQDALTYTEESIRVFQEDGERTEYKPNFYLNKVIYLEELGRDEEACRELEFLYEHIEHFKENIAPVIQIHEQYATLLLKSGLPIKALEYAQMGLQIAHKNSQYRRLFSIWTLMGNIHLELGKLDEAKTRYRKALAFSKYVKNSPDRIGRTHLNYGKLLITTGELELAEEQVTHSVRFFQRSDAKEIYLIDALVALAYLKKEEELFERVDEILLNNKNIKIVPVDIFITMCNFYNSNGNEQKLRHYQNLIYEGLKEGLDNVRRWRPTESYLVK